MNEIIVLIGALAVHEITHYIHFKIAGLEPKFGWVGIGPCVEPQVKFIPVRQVLMNMFLAITSGVIFLRFFNVSDIALFAYIVGCFMDMNNMQMLLIYLWRKTLTLDSDINRIKVVIMK